MKRFFLFGLLISVSVALLAWLFIESSKPLPGEKLLQDGRNHLDEGSKTDFKFNPPTSGNHYPSWIAKGFYDEPRADGNLVHSLEHGYIIFWYNCDIKSSGLVKNAYAQVGMTGGSEGSSSAKLSDMPKSFSDGSCDSLKNPIKEILKKFGPHKLIAVPRVGTDHKLILTAWGRALKLDSVDEGQIKKFIDAFRDNGPEATVEP